MADIYKCSGLQGKAKALCIKKSKECDKGKSKGKYYIKLNATESVNFTSYNECLNYARFLALIREGTKHSTQKPEIWHPDKTHLFFSFYQTGFQPAKSDKIHTSEITLIFPHGAADVDSDHDGVQFYVVFAL